MSLAVVSLGCCLLAATLFCACDDPPQAPPAEADVHEQREQLDQEVEQLRQNARERIAETDKKIPDRDAGQDAADQ
ncbi:MAG: hypothetical protein ACOC9J_05165 [Persicimonas sp.]